MSFLRVSRDVDVDQGGLRIAKKYLGSIFFKLISEPGLTKYVSGRLSIYGNTISKQIK